MKEFFPELNLPMVKLEISKSGEHFMVKCLVRKKQIVLTPEEWVRQQFINYLSTDLGYPLSLMKVEKQILVNGLKKRFDIVCLTNRGDMKLLVECKSSTVKLTPATFDQAARYNMTLNVPYLCITNGLDHFCASVISEEESVVYLKNIPSYKEVKD